MPYIVSTGADKCTSKGLFNACDSATTDITISIGRYSGYLMRDERSRVAKLLGSFCQESSINRKQDTFT
jgi:hypothetical protein